LERHHAWAISLIAGGSGCAALAFVSPGPWALTLSFVLYPVIFFTLVGVVIVYSMSADIVDYGRFMTGKDHAGLYGAFFAFLQKSLQGVSTAAGVALVGAFGFDATASMQSAHGILGIKLTAAVIPAIGLLGAAALIWNFPLTRARTAEVQAALKHRD
jgi:glucuronide carrier protein